MSHEQAIIRQTRDWLEQVVIKLNLCPFAAAPFNQQRIHYNVCHEVDTAERLRALVKAIDLLEDDDSIETCLLIFSDNTLSFDAYLDLLAMADALLDECGYRGQFQLASFHPDYRFEETAEDDASNYTNRSPYPMLHLLRENSLAQAIASYPDPENIPARNIKKMRTLGRQQIQKILDNITGNASENAHD